LTLLSQALFDAAFAFRPEKWSWIKAELYSQISWEPGLNPSGHRKARLTRMVKTTIEELATQHKQQALLCIDEANLLR